MKSKYVFSGLIYTIAFCMIIIPACDLRKDYSPNFQTFGVVLLLIRSLYSAFLKMNLKVSLIQIKIVCSWILLIMAFFPGYIVGNISLDVIIECIFLFLLYYVIFPMSDMELTEIMLAAVMSNLYIAYRCFFEIGIMPGLYQGTLTNPNQMALAMVGGVLGSLYLIVNYSTIARIIGLFSYIISCVLIFFTSSRSIMIIVVFATLGYVLFYLKEIRQVDIFSEGKISKRNFKMILICSCIVLVTIYYYRGNILNYIFKKWENTSSSLFSGRGDLWRLIVSSASLTGNSLNGINANNDFMDWMLKYGIISFFAYVIMISISAILLFKKYRNSKNEYIWHIIIIVSYLLVCMVENIHAVFGKPINILFWIAMGSVMVDSRNENIGTVDSVIKGEKIEDL